jgi:hypothetical protein
MARLKERAAAVGTTPEALGAADLEQANIQAKPGDRLRQICGAFDLGVSDAAANHDKYIGEALEEEVSGRNRD